MAQNTFLKLIILTFFFTSLISCNDQKEQTENKTASSTNSINLDISKSKVFTTSAGNDVKLQLTSEKIEFSDFEQPLETQASILVNPDK